MLVLWGPRFVPEAVWSACGTGAEFDMQAVPRAPHSLSHRKNVHAGVTMNHSYPAGLYVGSLAVSNESFAACQ